MARQFTITKKTSIILALALGLVLVTSDNAGAVKPRTIEGPVHARTLRVIDGDTILVRANIWLGQHITVMVRLAGIDAPELNSRNGRARERGYIAHTALQNLVEGRELSLRNIRRGKYAGRVIAEVYLSDGTNISSHMLEQGLADPYRQRSRKKYRCTGRQCRFSQLD